MLSVDNKRLLKYLGIIFIAVLLTYKLPHDSYSISQYMIRPIRSNNSVFYLSGLIPLVLFIIGIKGVLNLERFEDKNKILLFLGVIIIIIPLMKWTLGFTRTGYHWLRKDDLNAVDIVDANASLEDSKGELTINFNLKLIDYGVKRNKFKIRVQLPKTLSDYVGQDFCEFEKDYETYGNRGTMDVQEHTVFKLDDNHVSKDIADSKWYWEDFEYELYNEKEAIKIMHHGF